MYFTFFMRRVALTFAVMPTISENTVVAVSVHQHGILLLFFKKIPLHFSFKIQIN